MMPARPMRSTCIASTVLPADVLGPVRTPPFHTAATRQPSTIPVQLSRSSDPSRCRARRHWTDKYERNLFLLALLTRRAARYVPNVAPRAAPGPPDSARMMVT
eukprot:5019615-Prymnesium_polylepis.1